MTELMSDYSQGVVLEGNNPIGYVDLAVFVAPPPAAGERLFVRRTRDRAREQHGKVDAIELLLREPDGVAVARKAQQPRATQYWATSDRYSGIEHAQLVVVNVLHNSERDAAVGSRSPSSWRTLASRLIRGGRRRSREFGARSARKSDRGAIGVIASAAVDAMAETGSVWWISRQALCVDSICGPLPGCLGNVLL